MLEKLFKNYPKVSKEDLEEVLKNSNENVYLEFKQDINDEFNNLIRPIVGMANNRGGLLLLGVSDDKKIIGIDKNKYNKEKLSQIIREKIKPSGFLVAINITEVEISNKESVFIVGIPPYDYICAAYEKCDGKKHYLYFTMKNSEKIELTPEELQTLVYNKSDYIYNKEYRERIIGATNHYLRDTFNLINNGKGNLFVNNREIDFDSKRDFDRLCELVKTCGLKTLSINIYELIFELIDRILEIRKVPHKDKLTFDEDNSLHELLDIFGEIFGITDDHLKFQNIRGIMLERLGKQDTLSLEGYITEHIDNILAIYLNKMNESEKKSFHQELRSLLMSYNKNLEDLRNFLIKSCNDFNIDESTKKELIYLLENFPTEFCTYLCIILDRVSDLYKATKEALEIIK